MKKINLLFLIFCALFHSCSEYNNPQGKTVFRYNEAANISTLDPSFARDQTIIWVANQLYNGLIQLNDCMEIRPCIAKSWEISTSGLDYVFHLRNDVFFHDNLAFKGGKGRRVVAADFAFSYRRIIDPKVASPGAWLFNNISKSTTVDAFEALNDSTFIIHLERPSPPFIRLLSMQYCSVIPHEAISFYGNEFRRTPVGTGPFIFKMWQEGVKLVLIKNQAYFETENGEKLPFLDAVAISFVPDKQSAFLEFIKGRLGEEI